MINDKNKKLETYVNDFNRIVATMLERCILTGDQPDIGELETQVALRASLQKIASLRREITAMRSVLGYFLEHEDWPDGVELGPVFENTPIEKIGQAHTALLKTANDFLSLSTDVAREKTQLAMDMNFPGSEEDALRAISGMSVERSTRKARDKKNMSIITNKEFMELELQLSDHPHQNALRSMSRKRINNKSLLRIFMRAIRLSGMRPVEVFDCRIYIGDPNKDYSKTEIDAVYRSPYKAILSHMLVPLDQLEQDKNLSFSDLVKNITDITHIPAVLYIKSAKTTNANKDLYRPGRAMIISSFDKDDLEVLCLAAHLHLFKLSDKRRANLITTMTRNLSQIARKALPQKTEKMNLYSFRHDFATRARKHYHLWEVSALMGHTAKASTYHYGRRRTRKGSQSGGGYLPVPDQDQAQVIKEYWGIPEHDVEVNEIQKKVTLSIDKAKHQDLKKELDPI